MSEILQLKPEGIWKAFHALTQVPRPSGHLEKVTQFLLEWASTHHIEAFTDKAGNVIMRKPATPGYENKKTVTFQAHMDMVPQKTVESTHNFETDPIQTYIDGDWVKAKGTTLGADDGIGVATAMAIFMEKDLKHGPLEALITVDEESTMFGVNNLESNVLQGDILLNLDNETEGEMIVGSAGGINLSGSLTYKEEPTCKTDIAVEVTLKGLLGGHSGLQINEGRANANKLLVRFVREAVSDLEARLVSWQGGNMRNAIPRESTVILALPKENLESLKELVKEWEGIFKNENHFVEKQLSLQLAEVALPENQLPEAIQDTLIQAIGAVHNGVLRFIPEFPEIVETSSNLAIIDIKDGKANLLFLLRSSQESQLECLVSTIDSALALAGMSVETNGYYPAWAPNFDAPIIQLMKDVYKDLYQQEYEVKVVHAGLECGLIGKVYPKMELVSFGPTLRSPHTPDERCYIPSVEKYYNFVLKLVEAIPNK